MTRPPAPPAPQVSGDAYLAHVTSAPSGCVEGPKERASSKCAIAGCEADTYAALGMCWGHYRRHLRGAAVGVTLRKRPGASRASAVKEGPRKPTNREHRIAMFTWWLREGMVTPEPNTGCLLWTGPLLPTGYGSLGYHRDPWCRQAHRAALYLLSGVALDKGRGWHVRHRCDNRACVNVLHLAYDRVWLNSRDRSRRFGYRSLTPEAVAEAKRRVANGESQASVSRALDIPSPALSRIVSGAYWKWVAA